MWTKASSGESVRPPEVSIDASGVVVTRNAHLVEATDDIPEHYEYEEWQMSHEQYEVFETQQADVDFLAMENEYLAQEQEQARADIDYLLMITESEE